MVVRTILFYDLLCLALAFVPASGRPVTCLLGLLFFQLAFWTVYEVGNWENDVLGAAFEDKPNIPPGFEIWRGRVRPVLAYAWAAALSLPCAVCLAFSLQPAGEPLRLLPAVGLFGGLLLYLAAVRLVYALYNRVDTNTRVFIYPLMQIAKGVGLATILPVAPAGFMLLLSVVLVRQMRYVAYRATQMRQALDIPINLHVLTYFVLLCAVAVAMTGTAPPSFWIVAVIVAIWHLQRSRRPLGVLMRAFEWLPNRQHRSTATGVSTVQAPRTTDLRVRLKNALPAAWRLKRSVVRARQAGERELRFLPVLCRPGAASLDVGANRGVFGWIMREHSASVIAFEPNAEYAGFLRKALAGVQVMEAAASDHEGMATIRVPYREAVAGMGTIEGTNVIDEPFHESQVRTLTLDSLSLPTVGFMKIDVEGHELAVLRGAAELLERDRPNLLIEAEERHRPNAVRSIAEHLAAYGYRGLFYVGGAMLPIERFDPAVHQRLDPDRDHHGDEYVNNFLYVAAEDTALLERLHALAGRVEPTAT